MTNGITGARSAGSAAFCHDYHYGHGLTMPFRCFIVLVMLALSTCGENPVDQKGEKGDQGPPGAEGASGPAGPSWAAGHERNSYSLRGKRVSPGLLCGVQRE